MLKIVALSLVPIIVSAPGLAAPGVTTASVNFRSGPGTQFSSLRTLPAGTAVDIGDCEDAGSWCAITVDGRSGFVSGRYIQENKEAEQWPRSYETGKGRMILYQPQFTEWTDFKTIEALVAAQFVRTPEANPVFGVIGLKGKTSHDEDAGEVVITDIAVTELNFSGLGRDELTALAVETGKILPTGPITVSESRVTASLAEQKRMTRRRSSSRRRRQSYCRPMASQPMRRSRARQVSPSWSTPTGTSSASTTAVPSICVTTRIG
jgi:uncharacterized protein YgiM (DUF1202 family)